MVKLVDTPAGSSSVTGYGPFDSACAATACSAAIHDTSKASVTHLLRIVLAISTLWIVTSCYLAKRSCPVHTCAVNCLHATIAFTGWN